ncbi:MAG: hypothetical protein ABI851_10950 [Saprospiraceae bacterium]
MLRKIKLIYPVLMLILGVELSAQELSPGIAIIGFARFQIGAPPKYYPANFSCGINFGFHREIKIEKNFYLDLSFQPGITLYQRGLGTSILEYTDTDSKNNIEDKIIRQSSSSQIDLINAVSITLGGAKKPNQIRIENKSFQYFYKSSLTQDYNSSLTLGSNFITNINGRHQQVGFARISIWQAAIHYYNDGTPFQHLFIGDGKDRWWTGGGFIQYGNDRMIVPEDPEMKRFRFSFVAGFDRFTGYSHGMFELGNALKQSFVLHKDPRQYFLNSGRIYLLANDLMKDYAISLSANNIPWLDVQNLIHNSGSMSKHYSLLKESYSLGVIGFNQLKK